MHMQSSTRRWIAAVNHRREISEPEPGKGNCADKSSNDGIEDLASAFLQFDYSSALGQWESSYLKTPGRPDSAVSGRSTIRRERPLRSGYVSAPSLLRLSAKEFQICTYCPFQRGAGKDMLGPVVNEQAAFYAGGQQRIVVLNSPG